MSLTKKKHNINTNTTTNTNNKKNTKTKKELKIILNKKDGLDKQTEEDGNREKQFNTGIIKENVSPFLSTSRLNRGQRKYCHCLMQVRTQKKILPYGICKKMSYRKMIANLNNSGFKFKPQNTNCIMNYDYSKYSFTDVKNLAKERGIPIYNTKTGRLNNKNTIVQLLTKKYIEKHRNIKNLAKQT